MTTGFPKLRIAFIDIVHQISYDTIQVHHSGCSKVEAFHNEFCKYLNSDTVVRGLSYISYNQVCGTNMDMDFEELSHDTDIVSKIKQFHDSIVKIDDTIKLAIKPELYEKLSNPDKIQYNLLMSYCLNSLFWMYLRTEGVDPTRHKIKLENDRLKKSMTRAKQINDKKTLMPRLNKDVAQRFVRNGLWDMSNKKV